MLPQLHEKYSHPSLITPAKWLEYNRQKGLLPTINAPQAIIFCSHGRFLETILQKYKHKSYEGCFKKVFLLDDFPSIAIAYLGTGAPAAAHQMEALIAWGVTRFVCIGTAGTLHAKVGIGDIVLFEKAVRDEGTSYHYIEASKYIHAPRRMTNLLTDLLKQTDTSHHIGSTWTTDGFYRQTSLEIQHFQQEGVLAVEMETAALFAIAHVHQIDLGAMVVISDSHTQLEWEPHLEDEKVENSLHSLFETALKAATSDLN
ncbi:MAG: nucleoside phosphorylase [Candidatus Rhabdochlamydia sp.]